MATSLPLQNIARLVEPTDPPLVGPGQMRLYNYYAPGLKAGDYEIEAEQLITAQSDKWGTETLRVYNRAVQTPDPQVSKPQVFEVVAPQFNLDPKLINSYYPPDGHQDEGRILPHIVLNDPHLPWERAAGNSFPDIVSSNQDKPRNMVPWV